MSKDIYYDKDILKRFVKDYNIPISMFEKDIFNYLIDLYDEELGTKKKFELLKKTLDDFDNNSLFFQEYYELRDKIITDLSEKKEFELFNEVDFQKVLNMKKHNYPKTDIFNRSNDGKVFISIDLVKANFQCLSYFDKEIFNGKKSYEEFMKEYTSSEYIIGSKYLRQVIFGKLNPRRQQTLEKYITLKILDYLYLEDLIQEEDVKMFSADEIVFEVSQEIINDKAALVEFTNIIKNNLKELGIDVSVELFQLNYIGKKAIAKEFKNRDGYRIMCAKRIYRQQLVKKYKELELEEKDLIFYHEGHIVKFISPLFK